jgi:hypothetical protein
MTRTGGKNKHTARVEGINRKMEEKREQIDAESDEHTKNELKLQLQTLKEELIDARRITRD